MATANKIVLCLKFDFPVYCVHMLKLVSYTPYKGCLLVKH